MDPRGHNAKVNKRESKKIKKFSKIFKKKRFKKIKKKKEKKFKKKIRSDPTWPGPNLARPDPTWLNPNQPSRDEGLFLFQFCNCKKSSSGDYVQK